jgi:hypothetical protein
MAMSGMYEHEVFEQVMCELRFETEVRVGMCELVGERAQSKEGPPRASELKRACGSC